MLQLDSYSTGSDGRAWVLYFFATVAVLLGLRWVDLGQHRRRQCCHQRMLLAGHSLATLLDKVRLHATAGSPFPQQARGSQHGYPSYKPTSNILLCEVVSVRERSQSVKNQRGNVTQTHVVRATPSRCASPSGIVVLSKRAFHPKLLVSRKPPNPFPDGRSWSAQFCEALGREGWIGRRSP